MGRSLTASRDKTARLWEADSGSLLATFQGHDDVVQSAAFSADGQRVLFVIRFSDVNLSPRRPSPLFALQKKVHRRFNGFSDAEAYSQGNDLRWDVRLYAAGSHPGLKVVVSLEGGEYRVVGTDDRADTLSGYFVSGVY